MPTQVLTELYKFKRSKVLWIFIWLIALDSFSSYLLSRTPNVSWDDLLNASYMNLWVRPICFCFLSGYLFARDEEQRASGILFTYPYRRAQWYVAKLTAAAAVIALLLLICFALEWIIGLFRLSAPFTIVDFGRQAGWLVRTWLLYVALIPLGSLIAILLKRSVLCAIASVGGGLVSIPLGVVSSKYITLSPWLIPYLYIYYPHNFPDYPVWTPGILLWGILIVLSMALGLYLYTKKDIIYE